MLITMDELIELSEYSKALKCDIIRVRDKTMYGTDNNFVHLRVIKSDLNNKFPDMIFYSRDLFEFMKLLQFTPDISDINMSKFITIHYEYTNMFENLIKTVSHHTFRIISFYNDDLKSDDNFNTINAMKAGDGIGLLKLSERYILTLYNGLLPINKSDKVEVCIRDIDDYRYLANFTIVKKKFSIDIYFMYLFLNS